MVCVQYLAVYTHSTLNNHDLAFINKTCTNLYPNA